MEGRDFFAMELVRGRLDRRVARRIVEPYEAWDTAEPNRGHGAGAAKWEAELHVLDAPASSEPAAE